METAIYLSNLGEIGGTEQWIFEIAKKYGCNHNITLYYKTADKLQLERIKRLIRCKLYNNQEIVADTLITAYNYDIYDKSKAKENILTIHANYEYEKIKIKIHPKITKIYAVSETAKKGFENTHSDQLKKMNLKVEVLYNPYTQVQPKRVLRLISATRFSRLKGSEEMKMIAQKLNEKGYPFLWHVFTDQFSPTEIKGFIQMKPTLDIEPYIKDADYLIQVSGSEGLSYSMLQALSFGTPVICRDILVREEIGVINNKTGFVLNMNMSNLEEVVDLMYNNNLKGFDYKVKQSDQEYKKIFGEECSPKYKEELEMLYLVEALDEYEKRKKVDAVLGRVPKTGEQFEVDNERLEILLGNNKYKIPFVKLIKEVQPELKQVSPIKEISLKQSSPENKTIKPVSKSSNKNKKK